MTTDAALVIADVVVGGILVAAPLGRWRTSSGALLAASGGAWWVADLAPAMTFLHRGVLIQLVLSHPGGRLRGTAVQVTVVAGYLYASLFPIARNDVASLIMAAAVVGVAVHRHLGTSGPRRRSTAFALAAALCLGGALVVGPISRIFGVGSEPTVLATYDLLVVAVAVLVGTDMARLGSARGALTGLVVDLGELTGSDVLRDRLGAGLGDPGLVIAYRLPGRSEYIDDEGRALELPQPGDRRTSTPWRSTASPSRSSSTTAPSWRTHACLPRWPPPHSGRWATWRCVRRCGRGWRVSKDRRAGSSPQRMPSGPASRRSCNRVPGAGCSESPSSSEAIAAGWQGSRRTSSSPAETSTSWRVVCIRAR